MADVAGPKDPEEIKVLSFPFERELAGAAIAQIDYCTPTVYRGTDPNPAAIVSGGPVVSGTSVKQRVTGGLEGVVYRLRCKVTDANGNKHVDSLLLAVGTEYLP